MRTLTTTSSRSGKTQAEPVTAVLVHHDTNRYDLAIKTANRIAVIHTTTTHLFWDPTAGRWVKAAALKYGSYLRSTGQGMATVSGGLTPSVRSGWMWDLTVRGDHDFYVKAAADAVLVHNCGDPEVGQMV
jgi:hypothetical protein